MLTASQDIDNFIERERSRINKQGSRPHGSQSQQAPGPPPPPPPPPPLPPLSFPPHNPSDQASHREAHFSEEHSSHHPSQPSPHFAGYTSMEQQFASGDQNKSYYGFFDRFGTHEQVRARLNNDLKREYNEYLQSLQNMARKRAADFNTPRGAVTQQTHFQQEHVTGGSSQDKRAMHNAHSMNDFASSRTIRHSQSMNEGSSGRGVHNVHSMNDLSTTVTSELANNRARARMVQQHSEQYIRDREGYILELYEQIYELEGRIRQLEGESRKLTMHNSTNTTRARYTEDLNALNALLAERLNQRVAVDHELAQILDRPPVPYNSGRVMVSGTPTMPMPAGQTTYRSMDNLQMTEQTSGGGQLTNRTPRRAPTPQEPVTPRTRNSYRATPSRHTQGTEFNGIYGTFKTEEQVIRQEQYRNDLLQQMEEKRARDAADMARRRAEEERERLRQLRHQQELERLAVEEALRKQRQEEEERRRKMLQEEEEERKRREEELERQRKEEGAERHRRLHELARQRDEDEAARQKRREEMERLRKEDEAERLRRRAEAERLQIQEELERQRRKEEEEERLRREREEDRRRKEAEDERRRREEEEERKRREEEERRRRLETEEEERRRRRRLEEEEEERRRREEEERRRNVRVVRTDSPSVPHEGSDSEVLRRLMQLKRQLRDKENHLRDNIHTDSTTSIRTQIVDYTTAPYLPPPQPFYVQRREDSDDLLDVARIHYRDAPLTHDILLNILKTAEGDELTSSYVREDSAIMRGIGEGKRITSAEFLSVPKPHGISDELFSASIESLAGRRRYGNSLVGFYDDGDPVGMADKELNRIAKKSDHRVSKLRHIELDDGLGYDAEDVLERFEEKSRLYGLSSQGTIHDDAWLKSSSNF